MAKTLLLADDSVTIQKVVGISFASEDITITTVDNGDDALAKAREMRPDIILADVVMPGLTGYDVCEAVKADPQLAHIPVILLTGTFEAFDEDRANRVGAAGNVAKPFEAQTLVDRVKELIATAPAAQPAASVVDPTPSPAAESGSPSGSETLDADEAFDFFDEPSAETRDEMARPSAAPAASGVDFDVEGPEGAFAFGEDDLAGVSDGGFAPSSAGDPAVPADHTVAILPDEDLGALPPPVPATAVPAAEDGFDFEFESAPRTSVGGADLDVLADSAELDPGTSAFDVSSTDLGDLDELSAAPVQPVAATQILTPSFDDGMDEISSPQMLAPESSETPGADLHADDPIETGPIESNVAFIEDLPTQAPDRSIDSAVPETAVGEGSDLWSSDTGGLPVDELPDAVLDDPIAELPDAAPRMAPEALATASEPTREEVQAMADDALEKIAPALRIQLHETLEKIAWESFGQVAETVVEQAIAQVEKIAWEVVPKLAETLIQEELRKLKGE